MSSQMPSVPSIPQNLLICAIVAPEDGTVTIPPVVRQTESICLYWNSWWGLDETWSHANRSVQMLSMIHMRLSGA